jgi:hypothetical protein
VSAHRMGQARRRRRRRTDNGEWRMANTANGGRVGPSSLSVARTLTANPQREELEYVQQ